MEIIPDHGVSTSSGKDIPFDLGDTGHTGCQEVFSTCAGEFFSVLLRVHPAIGDKDGTVQFPSPQLSPDFLNSVDIGREKGDVGSKTIFKVAQPPALQGLIRLNPELANGEVLHVYIFRKRFA